MPLWAFIISLLTVAGIAIGAVLVTYDIETTMRIKMTVMLNVFDTDGLTPLTSITLGDFTHESSKFFPGGAGVPSTFYYINNTDEMPWYAGFTVTGSPSGVAWKVYIRKGNETDFTTLSSIQTEEKIYGELIESSVTNSNPETQFAHWYLYVYVTNSAAFGDYTPTLTVTAHDNPTG